MSHPFTRASGHGPRLAHQQNGRVRESGYTIKGEADPGVRVTLLVGSTEYTTVVGNHQGWWEVPVTLVAGDDLLKAKARDEAGNESPYSEELTLTVDRTPPEIEAAVSPLWQRTSQPVTITAVVTETDPLYRGDVWAEVAGPDPATRTWRRVPPGRPPSPAGRRVPTPPPSAPGTGPGTSPPARKRDSPWIARPPAWL